MANSSEEEERRRLMEESAKFWSLDYPDDDDDDDDEEGEQENGNGEELRVEVDGQSENNQIAAGGSPSTSIKRTNSSISVKSGRRTSIEIGPWDHNTHSGHYPGQQMIPAGFDGAPASSANVVDTVCEVPPPDEEEFGIEYAEQLAARMEESKQFWIREVSDPIEQTQLRLQKTKSIEVGPTDHKTVVLCHLADASVANPSLDESVSDSESQEDIVARMEASKKFWAEEVSNPIDLEEDSRRMAGDAIEVGPTDYRTIKICHKDDSPLENARLDAEDAREQMMEQSKRFWQREVTDEIDRSPSHKSAIEVGPWDPTQNSASYPKKDRKEKTVHFDFGGNL